jgi:hypothetical protein
MNIMEIIFLNLENYTLGAQFCRASNCKVVLVMYVHNSLKFTITDQCKYSKEKDIEICEVKLNVSSSTVHRSSLGNFNYFLQTLDKVLQSLYTPDSHIIICGDININYLIQNDQKRRLDSMLLTYNLTGIVNFPTRINGTSAMAIDNTFLDISHFEDCSVCPFINDLSDHYGQIVKIKTVFHTHTDKINIVRKVNKYTIMDFFT